MTVQPREPRRPFRRLPVDVLHVEEIFDTSSIGPNVGQELHKTASFRTSDIDRLEPLPIYSRELRGPERGVAFAMMTIGCAELVAFGWYIFSHQLEPKDAVVWVLLGLFSFAVTVTFALVFLWALRLLDMPKDFVKFLCVTTIAEVGTMLAVFVKHF